MSMDVGRYGQRLREMGTAGLESMAEVEAERQRQQLAQSILNAEAEGRGYGQLAGMVLGAAKGAYGVYQQKQTDTDVQQGRQSRKDFAELTDPVNRERRAASGGLTGTLRGQLTPRGRFAAQDMQRQMADLVALQPRVSQTQGLLGGVDTTLRSNDPEQDFLRASQYFSEFTR